MTKEFLPTGGNCRCFEYLYGIFQDQTHCFV